MQGTLDERMLRDAVTRVGERSDPAATRARRGYVDVFRGALIAHMALDHASLMFNAGRGAEELAVREPPPPDGVLQFLTRFTGVPVAPGFLLMAGFMVALTSQQRAERGVTDREITRRLVIRGLMLLAADTVLLGVLRAGRGFYSFMVLSCIGVSLILLAGLRKLPSRVLLPGALAVLVLHPLLDVSWLPVPLRAVLYEPVRTGAFRSLYPLVPWSAIVVLGFVVGRDALERARPARFWAVLGTVCLAVFFVTRLNGGFGNAYVHTNPLSLEFWWFAKYPPDLAFTSWALGLVFLSLAGLHWLTRNGVPRVLSPLVAFGRAPFFFYVAHFYVLGLGVALLGGGLGLGATYAVWLGLLIVMLGPCVWVYRRGLARRARAARVAG